jgi:hypothetical protein
VGYFDSECLTQARFQATLTLLLRYGYHNNSMVGLESLRSSDGFSTDMMGRGSTSHDEHIQGRFELSRSPSLTFILGSYATYQYCNHPYVNLET